MSAAPAPSPVRVTIDDVARRAGVSKATVSRYFNHREAMLSPQIAERVQEAVQALGYRPNPLAQALKRGRTRLIGMVVADVTNPFSVAVMRGAEQACRQAGYQLLLLNLDNRREMEAEAVEALAEQRVDGFIFNVAIADPRATDPAARDGRPAVFIDRRHAGLESDFVSLDNRQAAELAVEHLADRGYRSVLYVTQPRAGISSRTERAAAFEQAARAHVPPLAVTTIEVHTEDDCELTRLLEQAQSRSDGVLAIVAANAPVALRTVQACATLGWTLGRDAGFLAFDEIDWAALVGPGLTTIAQPTDAIGRAAVACLLERIDGQTTPPREILLSGVLHPRGSSRAPA